MNLWVIDNNPELLHSSSHLRNLSFSCWPLNGSSQTPKLLFKPAPSQTMLYFCCKYYCINLYRPVHSYFGMQPHYAWFCHLDYYFFKSTSKLMYREKWGEEFMIRLEKLKQTYSSEIYPQIHSCCLIISMVLRQSKFLFHLPKKNISIHHSPIVEERILN